MKNRDLAWIVKCAGIYFICLSPVLFAGGGIGSKEDRLESVCSVIRNAKKFEGRTIAIEATVSADFHSTVMQGPECGKGIYLSLAFGHSTGKWDELENAIVSKASGLDTRILHVKVRGIYRGSLPDGDRHTRQLRVVEVLDVKLDDPPRAGGPRPEK